MAEEDRERCRAAGIGDDVPFATKPLLATAMFARAVNAGVPFRWAVGDEVYGANPELREWLEEQKRGYVLAVACSAIIQTQAGANRAYELAALVPAGAWQRNRWAEYFARVDFGRFPGPGPETAISAPPGR